MHQSRNLTTSHPQKLPLSSYYNTKPLRIARVRQVHFRSRVEVEFHPLHRRDYLVPVESEEPFKRRPTVMVALKRFDLGDFKSNIHRIGVRAENVGLKGFQLYFETWHESQVFEAVVRWIAISK